MREGSTTLPQNKNEMEMDKMAKNKDVIMGFIYGDTKGKASSITIEGDKLYSYNTVIAQRINGAIVINKTKYSMSTTTCQNVLLREMSDARTVEDVRMGAQDLERYLVNA
jgi:hypothetical protein